MAERLSKTDRIRRAYIESIRTVILIDDEFPIYDRLGHSPSPAAPEDSTDALPEPAEAEVEQRGSLEGAPAPIADTSAQEEPAPTPGSAPSAASPLIEAGPRRDYQRAAALWRACRARGYACDIEDGSTVGVQVGPHIRQCDLVIFDYHLDPREQDPLPALRILRHLATTEHSSLVVVYTKDPNLIAVRRRVLAYLHGASKPEDIFSAADLDVWYGLGVWTPEMTDDLVDAFLRNDRKTWGGDQELRRQLKERGVAHGSALPFIQALLDDFLRRQLSAPANEPGLPSPAVEVSGPGHEPLWVQAGNLFVTFVHKSPSVAEEGQLVFDTLEHALNDRDPPHLQLVLAYARREIARGGFRAEIEAITKPALQAGWLYHALSAGPEEKAEHIRALFERLLSSLMERVAQSVTAFGELALPQPVDPAATRIQQARQLAHVGSEIQDYHIIHSLNEFLACERVGEFVQTGTLFSPSTPGNATTVWVCVTPACDMVPRKPREGAWGHSHHPFRPIIAIRGQLTQAVKKALETATQNRHVFLTLNGKEAAVALIDPVTSNPELDYFILDDMGAIKNGVCQASLLEKQDTGELTRTKMNLQAIGQLRGLYASRFLQQAGQHMSRIGVDFVNLENPLAGTR